MTPGTSDFASATRVRIDEAAHLPFVWKMTLGMRASKSPEVLALLTDGEAATMPNGKHAWGPVGFLQFITSTDCARTNAMPAASVRRLEMQRSFHRLGLAPAPPPTTRHQRNAGACPGPTAKHPSLLERPPHPSQTQQQKQKQDRTQTQLQHHGHPLSLRWGLPRPSMGVVARETAAPAPLSFRHRLIKRRISMPP